MLLLLRRNAGGNVPADVRCGGVGSGTDSADGIFVPV